MVKTKVSNKKRSRKQTVDISGLMDYVKDRACTDPMMFGLWAFGGTHFREATPEFHRVILKQALNHAKLAVAAPRGHGKSTILSFLYTVFCVCFKRKRHIVILQNTLSKACGSLNSVKNEIERNPLLRIFGIKMTKDAKEETVFEHLDGFQIRVICKGMEQMGSIRGEKFIAYRPDLVIVDDLEDDKMVLNPELRKELEEIFNDAVEPAVDFKDGGQIIFIGTVLHDDSLIARLISPHFYHEYQKHKFKAKIDSETVLWKERYDLDTLNKIERDSPEKFAKEYQNDPISGQRRKFKKEDFRYWTVRDNYVVTLDEYGQIANSYDWKDCIASIGCDLAWEEKRQSDFTAVVPLVLTPDNQLLIDSYFCKKGVRPDELERVLFSYVDKYEELTGSICPVGFEKAKHEKIMKWFLGRAMKERNRYIITKDVPWDRDKITRIVTRLQPRYINHTIYHRQGMGDYEHQLVRIPDGTHDDIPDAVQVGERLLQHPKKKKKQVDHDDHFQWLMKNATGKKRHTVNVFSQQPTREFPLPCKKSFK